MNADKQGGRVVSSLLGSLAGLALLLLATTVEAAAFSVASGNWTAAGTWSGTACGGAVGGGVPTAETVVICNGTSVVVNATAVAAIVVIQATGVLGGGTGRLTISGTPAITRTGTFNPQSGTVAVTTNANTTVANATAAAGSVMTFNNLELSPAMTGNRTYTLGAGQVRKFLVTGDFDIIPPTASGGTVRTFTVNDGVLTSVTVGGTLTIDAGGNEVVNFNTGNIPVTAGRIVLGGSGTGLQTLNAGSSTIALNAGSGTLFTQAGNGNFSAGTSTVVMSPSGTVSALLEGGFATAHAFNNLTLSTAATTTATLAAVTSTATIENVLSVASGVLDTGATGISLAGDGIGTFSISPGATFTLSGTSPFPAGFSIFGFAPTSTVHYRQTNNQSVSPRSYGNLLVTPGAASPVVHSFAVEAGSSTTSAVNLTIGDGTNTGLVSAAAAGVELSITGNVSISPAASLTANSATAATTFAIGGSWMNAGNFAANGGTVTFDGAAAQTISGSTITSFNNLTIANSNAAGVAMGSTQSVAVNGTLTLGANPFLVGSNTLLLNGPAIAGTPTSLSATSVSSLTFGGTSASVALPDKLLSLNRLTLNNTNGLSATGASTSVVVGGVLSLQSGVLDVGTANTLTTTSACVVSVTTSGTSWVRGSLRAAIPAAAACTFPLGDSATNYTPIRLTFATVTTPGSVTASVLGEDHRNTTAGTSGLNPLLSVDRYWTLKNSTLAGTYTARFTYVAGDNDGTGFASYRVRRGASCSGTGVARTCTPWGTIAVSGTPTSTITDTVSGITISADSPAQVDFAIGELDAATNFLREKQFIYTRELY